MPRTRSYSRSPSRNRDYSRKSREKIKKSVSRDRSREKYSSSSKRSSGSRTRKMPSRYKSSPSRRRSSSRRRSRSSDRYQKQKYSRRNSSDNRSRDYVSRRDGSKSRDKDRYYKRRSSSDSSSADSRSYDTSSRSSVESKSTKSSYKSDKEIPTQHDKINLNKAELKQEIKFTSVDLIGDQIKFEVLDQINSDEFVPKHFQSSNKKNLPENIKIDLNSETISVPKIDENDKNKIEEEDSIFHPNLYGDDNVRMEKWVRKLFLYRQKMFSEN